MNDEAESHCAEGQTVDAALRLGDQLLEQGDIDRAQAAFEQVEAAGDVRGSLKLAILMERHRANREAAEAAWRRELTKPEMSMAQRTWAGCSGIRGTGIQIRSVGTRILTSERMGWTTWSSSSPRRRLEWSGRSAIPEPTGSAARRK